MSQNRQFEDLYQQEYPRLVRHMKLSLPTAQDAEDLAQDAFLVLWEHWDNARHPRGYLWRSAKNMLSDWWRYRAGIDNRRIPLELKELILPVDTPLDAGLMAEWALDQLLPSQKMAVLARFVGYSYDEIVEVRGSTVGAAKRCVAGARARVRRADVAD